jgi:hypothetical protein
MSASFSSDVEPKPWVALDLRYAVIHSPVVPGASRNLWRVDKDGENPAHDPCSAICFIGK